MKENNSASQHPDKETLRLTTTNYVESIMGTLQDYSRQPLYYVFVHNDMCTYQILVNGILKYTSFKYEKLVSPINLNPDILRSGKQTLTYRLYPIGDQAVFEPRNEFGYDTSLDLNIYKKDDLLGLVSQELVLSHSAKIEKDGKMVFPGDWLDHASLKEITDEELTYGAIVVFQQYVNGVKNGGKGHVAFFYGIDQEGNYLVYGGNQGDTVRISNRSPNGDHGQTITGFYLPNDYPDNPKDNLEEYEKNYKSASELNKILLKKYNTNESNNGKTS